MLNSVKIARRQSEIRQALAELAGKETPTEDELRQMTALDTEYQGNETRYRAALVAEDDERREAGRDLETRDGRQFAELVAGFELRQAVLNLEEGRPLDGRTAEAVQELRARGGYRGVPVPLEALEQRSGETVASGTPDPIRTQPIIDRLFPASVAAQMGGQLIQVGTGAQEWPVVTSAVTAGWAATELGNVAGPTTFATTDRPLKPDQTLGIHMRISRKAALQSGEALEAAIRRDMAGAMQAELDRAIFQGSGTTGEPHGIVAKANATYGIHEEDVSSIVRWNEFRAEVVEFMAGNAATGPGAVRALIHPDVWGFLDGNPAFTHGEITEWDRMKAALGSIVLSAATLPATTGGPSAPVSAAALLTTTAGGVAPFFIGTWGAVDLIRDPFTDAQSGGLRLTALLTCDLAVARPAQLRVMKNLHLYSGGS